MPQHSLPVYRIAAALSNRATLIRFCYALMAALGSVYIGEHIFLGEYLTTDENSYMFQAWIFLQGKFSLTCPPFAEAFFHRMIICDDQAGWVSRYPPAHSIWLMPGVAIGYPRLMTAVAAFLAVWFLTKAGEKLKISVWCSGLLLLISPYFWLMLGSVLSHTSGLLATSIMIWAYLVWLKDRKAAYAGIAGLAWAFLFLNRTYSAVWIALPFGVDALARLARDRNRVNLIGTFNFAACSSLGVALYFLYNHTITGDALTSTFLYYNPTEGPGFGKVRNSEHTLAIGWGFLKYNFAALNVNLWGFSGSLLAWLMLSLIGWRKQITPLLLSAIFLVWISYAAFWFRGILEVQPIYYYETLAFMILSAGMGLQRLFKMDWPTPGWTKTLIAFLLIVSTVPLAFNTFKLNAQVVTKRNAYTASFQGVIRDVPPGSIVVLQGLHKDILAQNSWNPHGLDSDPLILRNVNGVVPLIPALFPNRPVFLVSGWSAQPAKKLQGTDISVRTIDASRMRSTTGRQDKSFKPPTSIARSPEHGKGLLGYAVKQYVIPGRYQATFLIEATGTPHELVGHVEVINPKNNETLASRKIFTGDAIAVLDFEVSGIGTVEPRVTYSGNGQLKFDRVEIQLIESHPLLPL